MSSGWDGSATGDRASWVEPDHESIVAVADKGLCIKITHKPDSITVKEDQRPFFWSRMSWHENKDDPWFSMDSIFKLHGLQVTKAWNDDLISCEYWMSEHHEGGGLAGVDPEYHEMKANLVAMGRKIMKEQSLQADIERHQNRKSQG